MEREIYVSKNGDPINWGPFVVTQHPELAVSIARVASNWNDLELYWAVAYTYLLGGNDQESFERYYSIRDWRKRKSEFFNATLTHSLSGALKSDARDLYAETEIVAFERNPIIHGQWAWSPLYPEALLLAQAQSMGKQLNRVFTALKYGRRLQGSKSIDLSRGIYTVYRQKDFESVIEITISLREKVRDLSNRIADHAVSRIAKKLGL